jgi:thiosulfate/3-mercaptopyruvate sulfurtransferase
VKTVDADALVANLSQPSLLVVDARAADRFRGENETLDPVGGHIPGAANRFFKDNLTADGYFKPADQLRRLRTGVRRQGPGADGHAVRLGRHGLPQSSGMEVAGLTGAALYPGSWSEWCADPKRPVATGS